MPFAEAMRLISVLLLDPSSALAAAVAGWKFPIDRTALAVMDLHDRFVEANSDPKRGRPKPHPGRPFPMTNGRRRGNAAGRTPKQVKEILNRYGHQIPV